MKNAKLPFWFLVIPLLVLFVSALFMSLLYVEPVAAQCGASASSCKNCHEVNAKHPVNGSGDWHTKHAFGDFCSSCHSGNVQAVDKTAAHSAMIYPLADPKSTCQSCHPADYLQRAEGYAKTLGVTLKTNTDAGTSNTSPGTSNSPGSNPVVDPSKIECKPIAAPGENQASGALLDYNRQYDIQVLGHFDSSKTGNLILTGFAGLFLAVGSVLVWRFERVGDMLRSARSVPDWRGRAASTAGAVSVQAINPPRQPARPEHDPSAIPDIVLPEGISTLDPETQAALKVLLADPDHGPAIIRAISQLDPDLIQSLQHLDRQDRVLLLAVVEKLGEIQQ